jgi:hypothetical protein
MGSATCDWDEVVNGGAVHALSGASNGGDLLAAQVATPPITLAKFEPMDVAVAAVLGLKSAGTSARPKRLTMLVGALRTSAARPTKGRVARGAVAGWDVVRWLGRAKQRRRSVWVPQVIKAPVVGAVTGTASRRRGRDGVLPASLAVTGFRLPPIHVVRRAAVSAHTERDALPWSALSLGLGLLVSTRLGTLPAPLGTEALTRSLLERSGAQLAGRIVIHCRDLQGFRPDPGPLQRCRGQLIYGL